MPTQAVIQITQWSFERNCLFSATISATNRFVVDTEVYSRVGAEIVMRIISLTTCRQLLVDSHTGREEHSGARTVHEHTQVLRKDISTGTENCRELCCRSGDYVLPALCVGLRAMVAQNASWSWEIYIARSLCERFLPNLQTAGTENASTKETARRIVGNRAPSGIGFFGRPHTNPGDYGNLPVAQSTEFPEALRGSNL